MQRAVGLVFDQWIGGGVEGEDLAFALERLPNYRVENIARTETMRASNEGALALYRNWGTKKKEWLATVGDGRTRPEHEDANGQVVGIDEPFIVGGVEMQHPGDANAPLRLVCQCRCTTIPVI